MLLNTNTKHGYAMNIHDRAQQAQKNSILLAAADTEMKNRALQAIAGALKEKINSIVAANNQDIELARTENLAAPLLYRLAQFITVHLAA